MFKWSDPGTTLFMSASYYGAWRFGPSSVLLTGLAQFICSYKTRMFVHCYPVKELLSDGIACPDLATFLETGSGKKFASKAKVVSLDEGEFVFVPCGWLAVPLCLDVKALTSDKKKAKPETQAAEDAESLSSKDAKSRKGVGITLTIPLPNVEWAEALPVQVFSAIKQMNSAFFETKGTDKLWKPRAEVFQEFCEAVEA